LLSVGCLYQKAAPGPIRGTLGRFQFLPKIHRDIGQKIGSAVYDTPQSGDLATQRLSGVSYTAEWQLSDVSYTVDFI